MNFESIQLVSHADWSKNPSKCWMCYAAKQNGQRWQVHTPFQVLEPAAFFESLKPQLLHPGCILSGFDFPIGLPFHYALKAGVVDFIALLPALGRGEWSEFYLPSVVPAEISLHRPFYPLKPGKSRRSHLENGLGLPFVQLFRLCEVAHENRRAACPLFWTMGAQQVGKAAIHAWQHLLSPALAQPELHLKIWPFSGSLDEICLPGNNVVVETYPAEFYGHLGILQSPTRLSERSERSERSECSERSEHQERSKRSQAGRKLCASRLISLAGWLKLDLDHALIAMIEDGFGDHHYSEDCFDALVGLYGMINVVSGNHPSGEPLPPSATRVEGWIFGQVMPERGK